MNLRAWATRKIFLPVSLLSTRSRYLRLAKQLQQRQWWSQDQIFAYQWSRLQKLVAIAWTDSSFYRHRFQELGFDSQWLKDASGYSRLPVTTKEEIEAHFPDGMTDLSKRSGEWQYAGTRGTTRRVVVVHDFAKRDAIRAGELVVLTTDCRFQLGEPQLAIPPDACSTHCGIEQPRAEKTRGHLFELVTRRRPWNRDSLSDFRGLIMDRWIRCYQSLPPLPPDADESTLTDYLKRIQLARPILLTALPEYLRALARHVEKTGVQPGPIPVIRPMGANMPESWKASVASAFGGEVREHYGSREMGPMAFDCQRNNGLHVCMDQFLIEVIDANGQPAEEGELGQVVVTDLENVTMPLLRYRIGDLARVYREPCPCGRNTMRIRLEGRLEDAFVVTDGRIVTSEEVSNALFRDLQIDQFELIENRRGQFELRYVPPDSIEMAKDVGQSLAPLLGTSEIRCRRTSRILPEASGKFRHCKSSSFHQIFTDGH